MRSSVVCTLLAGIAALSPIALAGPDWIEDGDAGSTLGEAQVVVGVGQLSKIIGSLGSALGDPDYEDMYLIRVISPTTFRFDLSDAGFDTQVWLFNVTQANEAFGLLANDDTVEGPQSVLTNTATDSTGAMLTQPGIYALAISGAGRVPVSRTGLIYHFTNSTEISGPDGPGGLNPHSGWVGEGVTGEYRIDLIGCDFVAVPAPGVGLIAGAALLVGTRRRR